MVILLKTLVVFLICTLIAIILFNNRKSKEIIFSGSPGFSAGDYTASNSLNADYIVRPATDDEIIFYNAVDKLEKLDKLGCPRRFSEFKRTPRIYGNVFIDSFPHYAVNITDKS